MFKNFQDYSHYSLQITFTFTLQFNGTFLNLTDLTFHAHVLFSASKVSLLVLVSVTLLDVEGPSS